MFTKKTNLLVCLLLLVVGFASFSYGNETHTYVRSAWGGNDYVDLRLVGDHSHVPLNGKMMLALEVKLKPGWVTYWTMPGVSGFPPKITERQLDNVAQFNVLWPAPAYHELPYSDAVGYDGHLLFPIHVEAESVENDVVLNVQWRIAVCEEICVLHEETLALTIPAAKPGKTAVKTGDYAAIQKAMMSVPLQSAPDNTALGEGYRVYSALVEEVGQTTKLEILIDRKRMLTDVPELYVSTDAGIRFGLPQWQIAPDGKQVQYSFPVFLPDSRSSLEGRDLTVVLVSDDGAYQTKTMVGPGL